MPYRDAARLYTRAGWVGVLPLPYRSKHIRLPGWTGHEGHWPSGADVQAWMDSDARDEGGGNIALRLPHDVLGVDVDAYAGKPGGTTLAEAETRWGPLPRTWCTTSRSDGISGIRLFRVPEGLVWPGQLGPGTELIQCAHRYALVWPSVHPEGRLYRWINPDGLPAAGVPTLDELSPLPEAWVVGLTGGELAERHTKAHLATDAAQAWLLAAPAGQPCRRMDAALRRTLTTLATGASRHETTRNGVLRLVRLAQEHHPGLASALSALHGAFLAAVTDPSRSPSRNPSEATSEWMRILYGAVGIVVANPGAAGTTVSDPCEVPFADLVAAPIVQLHTGNPVTTAHSATDEAEDPEVIAKRAHDQYVAIEVRKLRVRGDAQRLFAAEQAGYIAPPVPISLPELLAEPDEATQYRVGELWPVNGRVMLSAQYKSGKTTMVGNLVRCLADGGLFLARYPVNRPIGQIVVLDTEMSRGTLRRWLRDQKIGRPEHVTIVALRGQVASFNLLDPAVRAEWVTTLRDLSAETIILDCLRPILDALGLDENHDAGRILVALDELTHAAGATDLFVVHHMGHNGERSRGDSRLRDWPDVEWRLVRQDDDPGSARFFMAYGRDVEVPETALEFDPDTRHLTITGGSRKASLSADVVTAILGLLGRSPALSGRAIEATLVPAGHGRNEVRIALASVIDLGRVITEPGPRNAILHSLAPSLDDLVSPSAPSAPPARQRARSECASAPLGGALHSLNAQTPGARHQCTGALICPRCQLPTERLAPPDGFCPRCAYPAGGSPEEIAENT